jgi:aspartyl-tRNA(Asn)/glutamyl-tRNA(Gln) amidotransferase subunit A
VDDYLAPLGRDIRGLRIGVPRAYFFEGIDPEVERAFEEALDTLRRLGADVRDVEIPSLGVTHSFLLILMAEAFAYHERDIRAHPELYGDVMRERILAGALVTASEYMQAQRLRAQLCREMTEALQGVDVLATPTTPRPATPFAMAHDPAFGFPRSNMPPFNLTGVPALALPCGMSSSGLPLSLQLAGRPFEEGTVLRVGHAYEKATTWHTRRPPV